MKHITKDSGVRHTSPSGYQRDTQGDKPRFDLMLLENVAYKDQPLTLFAELLSRGAKKYKPRNFELADSKEDLDRAKSSLLRHCIQAVTGEEDEDHYSAIMFNVWQVLSIKNKQ